MGDTNISVTGFSNTTLGKKELNVSYAGQNTKFDVEIIQNKWHNLYMWAL